MINVNDEPLLRAAVERLAAFLATGPFATTIATLERPPFGLTGNNTGAFLVDRISVR